MGLDLAKWLVSLGHCVTVLCPQPSRPLGADYSRFGMPSSQFVAYESSIKVVRLPSFTAPKSKFFPRMRESFSFGREVVKYLTSEKEKPNVLYVNSWPMFAQALIAQFAKKNQIPMVLQIMDVYPESLTEKLPTVLSAIIQTPLEKLDTWLARAAVSIVVISENMRKTYTEGRQIPAERVFTISTWQDETAFENILPRPECCSKYGISDHPFTFLFLGNIGPVAGVDFLIHAFAEASMSNAQLLIVGDGARKSDCVKLVKQLGLSQVHFISDPDAASVPTLQGMAHVYLLPMKHGSGMSSIPSKLPSYLFSAKPVIATVDSDSDTANFVRQAECGWIGDAEDVTWLASKMREVSQLSTHQLETFGRRGKKYALEHFSKSTCVVRLANTITQACSKLRI